MNNIYCNDDVLSDFLCDDIIELFNDNDNDSLIIPKHCNKWNKIEKILYRELLINIKKYKNKILNNILNKNDKDISEVCKMIDKDMYLKHFKIIKIVNDNNNLVYNLREKNRYNVISFIYFLNDSIDGKLLFNELNFSIKPQKGTLLLFPDNINYINVFSLLDEYCYIITGQIYNNN